MTWGVVMMEHLFVCNVCSHANDPFSETFKDVFIKKHSKERFIEVYQVFAKKKVGYVSNNLVSFEEYLKLFTIKHHM